MTRIDFWVTGFAAVGTLAGIAAAALFWLVVAHPIAVVQALSAGR
jgi:hypothetical protein